MYKSRKSMREALREAREYRDEKDIDLFATEGETIDKYKKRYKDRWKDELEKAVLRMKKEL